MNTNLSKEPILERNGRLYRNNYEVIKTTCKTCNVIIYRKPRELASGNSSYCSLKCKQTNHDPKGATIMTKLNDLNFYYLLGLLATDGYVNNENIKNGHGVRLGFAKKDDSSYLLLKKIQNYFGGKIYEENHNAYYLYFYNKEFRDYLISIGITTKKSLTLNIRVWFEQLNDNQKWAFVRGCWDGDGCLSFFLQKRGDHRGNASFVSASKSFIDMIYSFLGDKAKLYVNKNTKTLLYTININSLNVPKVLYKLYENMDLKNDLYLERKYKVYKTIEHYYCNIT